MVTKSTAATTPKRRTATTPAPVPPKKKGRQHVGSNRHDALTLDHLVGVPVEDIDESELTLAKAADLGFEARARRLEVQKQVDRLEEVEKFMRKYIIRNMDRDSTGVAGLQAFAKIVPKVSPVIEDFDKFTAFIIKSKRFDLLQKRLSSGAIEEFWDNGKEIPGIGRFGYKDVSLTKVK